MDGFLDGDALLLAHDAGLLALVDAWVTDVSDGTFDDLLPLLRRSFSQYTIGERRQLGHRLQCSGGALDGTGSSLDLVPGLPAARAMGRLLGLEVAG